jgi:glutathione S-transferase
MQLIFAPASPFVRKVRVVILETGLADRVEEVLVSTSPVAQDPAVVRANPLGKIPVLTRDDGPAIYDSRVITRYLDSLAGSRLYPAGRIWEVLTLEATADGIMDAAVALAYERRFREGAAHEGIVRGNRDRVTRALDVISDRWMSHLGGPLDIGQIAVACALGYLDLRHPDMAWRDGRTALAEWCARFAERDSMKATEPQG